MWCELALEVGEPSLTRLQRSISSRDFTRWLGYRRLRGPLHTARRGDYHTAQLIVEIRRGLRIDIDEDSLFSDYMIDWEGAGQVEQVGADNVIEDEELAEGRRQKIIAALDRHFTSPSDGTE